MAKNAKPKEFKCKNCGRKQYVNDICRRCSSDEFDDLRVRSLSFWENEFGLEMGVTKREFAEMIKNYRLKSFNNDGGKAMELFQLMYKQEVNL